MSANKKISELADDPTVSVADYIAIVPSGSAVTKKVRVSNLIALANSTNTAQHFAGKYVSLPALQSSIPVGSDGDYAIVTASPTDLEYIWDSTTLSWILTSNTPAGTFAQLGGNPDDNAALHAALADIEAEIASGNSGLQSQIDALTGNLVEHPAYIPPNAGITSTQTTDGLEVGEVINIPLSTFFNQNDGGAEGAISIKKDGVQIATTATFTDPGVVITTTAKMYQAGIAYATGPVKNNILGTPDPVGQIVAGTANSNTLSYQGFYKIFYDAVSVFPSNSAQVRGLSNSRFSNDGNSFILNTGSTLTKFTIAIPPGKTLVSVIDLDALDLGITAQYTATTISVNDAAGTPVSYTLYSMSQSIPYTTNHRHNITIA